MALGSCGEAWRVGDAGQGAEVGVLPRGCAGPPEGHAHPGLAGLHLQTGSCICPCVRPSIHRFTGRRVCPALRGDGPGGERVPPCRGSEPGRDVLAMPVSTVEQVLVPLFR